MMVIFCIVSDKLVHVSTAAIHMWVVRVVVRLCLWTVRGVYTTAPSSMSCSMPWASTMNRPALTGTTTSGCTGKTSLMVRPFCSTTSYMDYCRGTHSLWMNREKESVSCSYINQKLSEKYQTPVHRYSERQWHCHEEVTTLDFCLM